MLLAARDPENPNEGGMSDTQIRDEAMTIFLAGHETTANAMAWTWHLLGTAPQVEARLHQELDRVLRDASGEWRTPAMDDVPKLEWTRAVVSESMRLFPPAWTMGRRALESHTLGGYVIEKGALVIMSQWVVHRDPRWWGEPESFQPYRWISESEPRGISESESPVSSAALSNPASPVSSTALVSPTSSAGSGARLPTPVSRPKYSYFPFGGGSRVCIGESFAWTEAILLLATIAQRWRFVRGEEPAPTTEPRITLRPKGLRMTAVERSG